METPDILNAVMQAVAQARDSLLIPLPVDIIEGVETVDVDVEFYNYEEHYTDSKNVRGRHPNILDAVEHATRRGENICVKVTFDFELGAVDQHQFEPLVIKAKVEAARKLALQTEIDKKKAELKELELRLNNGR